MLISLSISMYICNISSVAFGGKRKTLLTISSYVVVFKLQECVILNQYGKVATWRHAGEIGNEIYEITRSEKE